MHLSIRYPRSQVALHSTHLTFEMFLATSFAEPKLSELVSTLIGESNFASWSTALKYALDTRVETLIFSRSSPPTPAPAPTITLPSQLTRSTLRLSPATPPEGFLRLVTEALSLNPETRFSFLSERHRLKLVRYPASDLSSDSNIQGVDPHKNSSGWWIFLLQASAPTVKGLQA
ncbi:hypothetical protein PENPOL_c004G10073 [Penicillium polonicum]|uniref:Uncharacterized protein n=1 Tax=Penicillium polonicum TaxID=60169 RepID=A0A1V6NQV3_PENPO|nr:hypothetical protein PENPOL_c004G10073 [Penicillium polonicum]